MAGPPNPAGNRQCVPAKPEMMSQALMTALRIRMKTRIQMWICQQKKKETEGAAGMTMMRKMKRRTFIGVLT